MAGTEVMFPGGTNLKDSLSAEKVPEHLSTPEKTAEREKTRSSEGRLGVEEREKTAVKGALTESPGKNKGGTPKKNEVRNVFPGPRQSPKKNPWTRNTTSEGTKETAKEPMGGATTSPKEVPAEGKGIEIPKSEVNLWLYVL